MKSIINSHNRSLCEPGPIAAKPCNCRRPPCPMDGECRASAIVYKASVTTDDGTEMEYIGSTETEFKLRYSNHKSSFKNHHLRSATKLSQYIWTKKTEDITTDIAWKIQHQSRAYKCGTRKCDLCISEKLEILRADPSRTLNRRSEIANKCKHRFKHKLGNLK